MSKAFDIEQRTMTNRTVVSSAEFIRNIGYWQTEALRQPLSITHHGRERLVLATPDAFGTENGGGDAEMAIAAVHADHAALLESLDEGFLAVDAQLQVVKSNITAETFIGRARMQLRGMTIFEAMPLPLGSILADRLQRTMRSRKREDLEAASFDGRHLRMRVFPSANGASVLFHNTTEQYVLRQQLERSEALDAAVRHHSKAASLRLDGRARVEAVDDLFCTWSGFVGSDVVGHRFIDLISPSQRREAGDVIERVLRDAATRQIALTLLGKRGEEMPGVLALAPILTDCVAHGAQALWIPHQVHSEEAAKTLAR